MSLPGGLANKMSKILRLESLLCIQVTFLGKIAYMRGLSSCWLTMFFVSHYPPELLSGGLTRLVTYSSMFSLIFASLSLVFPLSLQIVPF